MELKPETLLNVAPESTLQALVRGENETRMVHAIQYPRKIGSFLQNIEDAVTFNEDIAMSCMYSVPRAGKRIEGESIRFAEIAFSCWKNAKTAGRIIEIGDKEIVAQGAFIDLENNTEIQVEVRRRITNRHGERFNDDMILVTGNAAISIAIRNAILRGIPKAYTQQAYAKARRVAIGDVKALSQRRESMVEAFGQWNISLDQIAEYLGKEEGAKIDDLDGDDVLEMRVLYKQIKGGETSIDTAFPPHTETKSISDMLPASAEKPEEAAKEETTAKAEAKTEETGKQEAEPAEEQEEADTVVIENDMYPTQALRLISSWNESAEIWIVKLLTGITQEITDPNKLSSTFRNKFINNIKTIVDRYPEADRAADCIDFIMDEGREASRKSALEKIFKEFEETL